MPAKAGIQYSMSHRYAAPRLLDHPLSRVMTSEYEAVTLARLTFATCDYNPITIRAPAGRHIETFLRCERVSGEPTTPAAVERLEAQRPDRKGRARPRQARGRPIARLSPKGVSQTPGRLPALHPPPLAGRGKRDRRPSRRKE